MTFKQYWKPVSYLEDKQNGNIIHDMAAASWDSCKKEVLKILNKEGVKLDWINNADYIFKKLEKEIKKL